MKTRSRSLILITTLFALALPVSGTAAQKHHHYKLVDLGTFGGPTAYGSISGAGYPLINNSGVISSSADTAMPDPNASTPTSCFNPDCFLSHAFHWQDGVLTDIGALPGVNSSAVGAINERGWSVGLSQNGVMDPLLGVPEIRATLWKDGQIVDLGTLGGNESFASSLNNKGIVVGAAANTIPDPVSLIGFFGTQTRAFLWRNGVMHDLGTLGGPDAFALAVNERGQVVGYSYTNATPNPVTRVPTTDPFLWDHGTMIDLGTLGGTDANVGPEPTLVINNKGQVAGTSNLAGDVNFHAFLWDRGTLLDLGTLGGHFSTAYWINDAGDVVGGATTSGDPPGHAALWRKGKITDLGTLDGDCFSQANAINSKGQIVGLTFSCDTGIARAVLWEEAAIIDLSTLVPAKTNLFLAEAFNINDRGEILCRCLPAGVPNGELGEHVCLLIPSGKDNE